MRFECCIFHHVAKGIGCTCVYIYNISMYIYIISYIYILYIIYIHLLLTRDPQNRWRPSLRFGRLNTDPKQNDPSLAPRRRTGASNRCLARPSHTPLRTCGQPKKEALKGPKQHAEVRKIPGRRKSRSIKKEAWKWVGKGQSPILHR